MATSDQIKKRFSELDEQMRQVSVRQNASSGYRYCEPQQWQRWATSVQSLLVGAFGPHSTHADHFRELYSKSEGSEKEVELLKGVFLAAKDDYEGGYIFSLESTISGEIYGDLVGLAKLALSEGSKEVSSVLACAALEDALKRYAQLQGLDTTDKSMQDVVNALKSKGLVSGAQKTLLDTMPKVRDYAMHANWDKITPQDVGSVIGFVEQFLLAHFS